MHQLIKYRAYSTAAIWLLLLISCSSYQDKQNKIVYITNEGNRYHEHSCRYLGNSSLAISLADAHKKKYEPCSECIAIGKSSTPVQSVEKTPPKHVVATWRCTGYTKTGTQCKRYTRNPKKKCFQHD